MGGVTWVDALPEAVDGWMELRGGHVTRKYQFDAAGSTKDPEAGLVESRTQAFGANVEGKVFLVLSYGCTASSLENW